MTETKGIVAVQATWVPLSYDVDIDGTGVIHVRGSKSTGSTAALTRVNYQNSERGLG